MSGTGSFLELQNGSDIRGTAMSSEVQPTFNLTGEAVNRIAAAFGHWLAKQLGVTSDSLRIGVGHDSRLTALQLKKEINTGLESVGAQVFDCGLASTPAMFMGTVFPETNFDGSIMITASHLPKDRNGMKFFARKGGLEKQDITELLLSAEKIPYATGLGEAKSSPLMDLYAAYLQKKIIDGVGEGSSPLTDLHIIVDAGNGAGGFFVHKVLQPLGANCTGSQFLEPDGSFPNHQPNPENKEAMASICNAVQNSHAHLGIIFDTDVDRMSAVTADGREVNRNAIIALMASILAPNYPRATIVTDSVTSDRLTEFLQNKLGLRHHCFKRGYKNVINEAIRLNEAGTETPLAIETSGHGALKENYFLDDGAYMAVRIIIAAAKAARENKDLSALLQGFTQAEYEAEFRLPIEGADFLSYGQKVLEEFADSAKSAGLQVIPSFEGVRLSYPGKGWAILRMSLHDPIMPLNVESNTAEGMKEILDSLQSQLQPFNRLKFQLQL